MCVCVCVCGMCERFTNWNKHTHIVFFFVIGPVQLHKLESIARKIMNGWKKEKFFEAARHKHTNTPKTRKHKLSKWQVFQTNIENINSIYTYWKQLRPHISYPNYNQIKDFEKERKIWFIFLIKKKIFKKKKSHSATINPPTNQYTHTNRIFFVFLFLNH